VRLVPAFYYVANGGEGDADGIDCESSQEFPDMTFLLERIFGYVFVASFS